MLTFSNRSIKNLIKVNPILVFFSYELQSHMNNLQLLNLPYIDFTIVEGRRTKKRQKHLFDNNFSKTLNSKHITGDALDIYPCINGKVSQDLEHFKLLINIATDFINSKNLPIFNGFMKWSWDMAHYEIDNSKYYNTPNNIITKLTK